MASPIPDRAATLLRTLPPELLNDSARELLQIAAITNTERRQVLALLRRGGDESIDALLRCPGVANARFSFAHALLDALEEDLALDYGWVRPPPHARPPPPRSVPPPPAPANVPPRKAEPKGGTGLDSGKLRAGMGRETFLAWAVRHHCEDLLALPTGGFARLLLPGAYWCQTGGYYQKTLLDVLSAPPSKLIGDFSRPPAMLVEALIARLETLVSAPAMPLSVAPRDAAAVPAWERLRALATPLPDLGGGGFNVRLDSVDALLSLSPTEGSACGALPGTIVQVNLDAPADRPCVTCDCGRGLSWCRTRASAAGVIAATIADPQRSPDLGPAIVARLATPAWKRRLDAMDATLLGVSEAEGELGWAIDGAKEFAIYPVLVTSKARGGHKLVKLSAVALATWRERSVGSVDRALLELADLDLLRAEVDPRVRLPYLALLVDHPRVFAWERDRAPLRVVERELAFELDSAPDGGARLAVKVDRESIPSEQAFSRLHGAGLRRLVYIDDGATLVVLAVPPDAARLVQLLARRGDVFPAEAVPGLLERLPRIAHTAPVRVSSNLDAPSIDAPTAPEIRLELAPVRGLSVAFRARPHPKAAAELPGEGSETIPVMTDEGIVIVRRDLDGEVEAAGAVATRLGLASADDVDIQAADVLFEVLAALRSLGPEEARVAWQGRPPTLLREGRGADLKVKVGAQGDWFGLQGGLDVDEVRVPLSSLLAAMREGRTWIAVEGDRWLKLEETLRRRLATLAAAANHSRGKDSLAPSHAPALAALAEEGAEVVGPRRWDSLLDRLRESATLEPEVPSALKAELRPYQVDGYRWLTRLLSWAGGAVLADDMGLGKTVQALAVLVARQSLGVQLVVAPTSVGFNWIREAKRFAPGLTVHFHHGEDRPDSVAHLGPGHLLVTTYDILVRDAEVLVGPFATLVVDEAQAVKNHETQRARAVAGVKAEARIALSGTPVENRLSELWSLFHVVVPGFFGGWTEFRSRWAIPVERDDDRRARAALAGMVRPFILRRLKSEVAKELPARIEVRVDVELDAAARRQYEAVRTATLAAIGDPDPAERARLRFRLLAALTRLRQIACDPGLVDPGFTGTSAKLDRLVELLEELRSEGRRALVFSQFSELLGRARERLAAAGFSLGYLDGSTPAAQRAQEIDRFQAGGTDVFLLSLKAGGTGLNLTAASDVVLLEPWWNPAVEDQAADRAHRIGQTRTVTVYRLVALGTLEEQVLAMHARKRDLASAVLDGTGDAGALDVAELLALLQGEEVVVETTAAG